MPIAERILLALSRDPAAPDYGRPEVWDRSASLHRLRSAFPDVDSIVGGRKVLDFGCGSGHQVIAAALAGAERVVGVDMNERLLERGRALAIQEGVTDRVRFVTSLAPEDAGSFDVVISQNSMEHFGDPGGIIALMAAALRPAGRLLITFAPPWYAPYGSHMHFFTMVPWVHLLFSERTVLSVRSRFRSDGARRYEEIEGGLNRMSLAKFERLIRASGLEAESLQYRCVKRLDALGRVPLVRELLVNQVDCILCWPRRGTLAPVEVHAVPATQSGPSAPAGAAPVTTTS